MFVVGLTGRMASGKTTAMNIFKKEGFFAIDADKSVSYLYDNNQFLKSKINSLFFPKRNEKDDINKLSLIKLIEKDGSVLNVIEELVFPELFLFLYKDIKNRLSNNKYIILEASVLHRCGLSIICDLVISTIVDVKTQIYRINERRKYSEKFIKTIIERNNHENYSSDFQLDANVPYEKYKMNVKNLIYEKIFPFIQNN
ncbi:dephospho-CoA kinase [Anaplasmataceae bacterium AB001_6]|nr:dephospho-CoA kinase [Anaplasmataceae bacterium AB001_6]